MPSMPASVTLPVVTPAELALHHTRFSNWFPLYRRHSPKATIIDLLTLQPDFVDWLEEDGLILPKDSNVEADESDDDSDDEDTVVPRDFGSLNERIRQVLSTYEGAVFPKLDWSAPSDAAWIVPGSTLRCTTPSDIYLLLKSSDFISKDISQLRELQLMKETSEGQQLHNSSNGTSTFIRPVLVLKKFFAIPTSYEFRCFVRAGKLICISQRDTGTYFEHLQDSEFQLRARRLLQRFYNNVLSPIKVDEDPANRRTPFPIDDFVWDAYISRDMSRVFLMDINPFLQRTDGLLWTWSEIEDLAERRSLGDEDSEDDDEVQEEEAEETIMRIFTDGREPVLIRPNGQSTRPVRASRPPLARLRTITSRAQTTQSFPTYARNMVPSDVVGAAEGNDIADFAREWNRKIAQAVVDEVDGEEGDDEVVSMPGR